jgi:hypothetical protein
MISNEDPTPLDAVPRGGQPPCSPLTPTPRQDSATPEPVRRETLRVALLSELREAFYLYAVTVAGIVAAAILLETCL